MCKSVVRADCIILGAMQCVHDMVAVILRAEVDVVVGMLVVVV